MLLDVEGLIAAPLTPFNKGFFEFIFEKGFSMIKTSSF